MFLILKKFYLQHATLSNLSCPWLSTKLESRCSLCSSSEPNTKGAGVSSLQWYPHDTGIFATSSFGGHVYIWDANEEEVQFYDDVSHEGR